MSLLVALALAVPLAAAALRWRRRLQASERELEALAGRVGELTARLEAAEDDLASTLASAGVAERLLLEKGILDEDEVEAMRRRLGGVAVPAASDDVH